MTAVGDGSTRLDPSIYALFTQHAPSLFELFLVDLAFGEPYPEDVQGRLAGRAMRSTARSDPAAPSLQPWA